jgi:hypothetical protein
LNALFNYFVNLCLLRAAPQDLPSSSPLLGVVFVINALIGTLLMATTELGPGLALVESLFELALMLGVLRTALFLRGHPARFNQGATAVMGSSILMSLLALPLLAGGVASGGENGGGVMLLLGLVVWSVVILGHILRHTFDLTPGQGVAVAALYSFASYQLTTSLFSIG